MRVIFALMVVAAAVQGMETTKRAEMIQKVQATEFGATVLADLQDRLNAGDPIDALREFIEKIRTRIKTEMDELTTAQNANAAECLAEVQGIDAKIKELIGEIAYQVGEIGRLNGEITRLRGEIQAKEIQIENTQRAIAYNENAIEMGDEIRAAAQAEFEAAVADTEQVVLAIEEIREIIKEGSVLHANQDETTAEVHEDTHVGLSNDAISGAVGTVPDTSLIALEKLQKVAEGIHDSTAQSFIQLAALSSQALGGDVNALNTLLDRLLAEVKAYNQTLSEDNAQTAADWVTLRQTMVDEIAGWKEDLARYESELAALQDELNQAKTDQRAAIQAYRAARDSLAAKYEEKGNTLQSCSDEYDAYNTEMAQSREELETLDLIYEIIKDKLADAESEIAQNVDQLMTGGTNFAPKCHCDHACDVFKDCCEGCAEQGSAGQNYLADQGAKREPPSKYHEYFGGVPNWVGGKDEMPSASTDELMAQYLDNGQGSLNIQA